jgi:hypothetical protein
MFMQAWGNYGTIWPVIHQQLGVEPFLNDGELDVVPQVPPDQPSAAGSNIRLGGGSLDAFASRSGSTYTTKIDASSVPVRRVRIGYALPRGSNPVAVTLDGQPVSEYDTRATNRGLELSVVTDPGVHTLEIVTG